MRPPMAFNRRTILTAAPGGDSEVMMLAPGESRTVRVSLSRTDLEFVGAHNQRLAEPGDFDLWLGQSSEGGLHGVFTLFAEVGQG